jgi:hypothetical protein
MKSPSTMQFVQPLKKQKWQHATTMKFRAAISFHGPNNIFCQKEHGATRIEH